MVAALSASAATWMLEQSEAANKQMYQAITNAYAWVYAGQRSGDMGAPLDPDKDYATEASKIVYTLTGGDADATTVFRGRSLTLGRVRQTAHSEAKTSWDNWGTGGGLILSAPGYYTMYVGNVESDIYGKVRVETTADSPFPFQFEAANSCMNFHGDFAGGSDAAFKINGLRDNVSFKFSGSLDNYLGSVAASNVTLHVGSTVLAGSLSMDRATLTPINGESVFTVGTLNLGHDVRIMATGDMSAGTSGLIAVTNALHMTARPVTISIDPSHREGLEGPVALSVLSVPAGVGLHAGDFSVDAGCAGWTRLAVSTNSEENTCVLSAVIAPVVEQTVTDANIRDPNYASSFNDSSHWSDNAVPHRGAHYLVPKINSAVARLRTPTDIAMDYVFPGETLTIDGSCELGLFYRGFSCNELRLGDKALVMLGNGVAYGTLGGRLALPQNGHVFICAYNGATFEIAADVTGSSRIVFDGTHGNASGRRATTLLTGDNSRFTGTITVGLNRDPMNISDNKFQTLKVSDPACLGAPLVEFDATALVLKRLARLHADSTFALSDLTRGVYIGEDGSKVGGAGATNTAGTDSEGQIYVSSGETLSILSQLTLNGRLHKYGAGTLALGGALRFGPAAAVVDEPHANSNSCIVAEGYVKPLSADAFNGMEMTFAAGSGIRLDIDPQNADLRAYGLRNTKVETPFATMEGKISVDFDVPEGFSVEKPFTIGVVTVPAGIADSVFSMLSMAKPEVGGCRMIADVASSDDIATIIATFKPVGFSIQIR